MNEKRHAWMNEKRHASTHERPEPSHSRNYITSFPPHITSFPRRRESSDHCVKHLFLCAPAPLRSLILASVTPVPTPTKETEGAIQSQLPPLTKCR